MAFCFAASMLHVVSRITVLVSTEECLLSGCLLKRETGILCIQVTGILKTFSSDPKVACIWPAKRPGQVGRRPEGQDI